MDTLGRLNLLNSVKFPPGQGVDPVLREEPGQPIQIAVPPEPNPELGPEALMEMLGVVSPGQSADPLKLRSALMYVETARKALEAASDELPTLKPLVTQVDQLLGYGIHNVMNRGTVGRGFPIAVPPSEGNIPVPMETPETLFQGNDGNII